MKRIFAILFLIIAIIGFESNAEAVDAKANFVAGTIDESNILGDAETTSDTFAVLMGTYANDVPNAASRVVVYGGACSRPSACGTREIVTISASSCTGTSPSRVCTLTITARNQESTTHSGDWVAGSKVDFSPTAGTFEEFLTSASSTDNAVARFDGTTGKLLQNSGITIGDTGIMTVPAGSVTAPSIVSDDADSGFYFGSKGFNWGVDGAKVFGVDSSGHVSTTGYFIGSTLTSTGNNLGIALQRRDFTAAGRMVDMVTGTATFTGFDGEIVGVNIMPTVGVLDDGDTMSLLKLAPQGTPASTLGLLYVLSFGNWGGTGTDKAAMINTNATGYDADIVRRYTDVTCAATVCTDVTGAYAVYVTTTGTDTMTIADGAFITQEKFISHKTDGGQVTVTPTNFSAGTSVTMAAAGDTMLIHWNGAKWDMVVFYGGVLNP